MPKIRSIPAQSRYPSSCKPELTITLFLRNYNPYPNHTNSIICNVGVANMASRRRMRSSTSHRLDVPPVRLCKSESGRFRFLVTRSGTTCLFTSHLRRHSRFQTTIQDLSVFPFLPRHYHMTRVLLLPFITTVWAPVFLSK